MEEEDKLKELLQIEFADRGEELFKRLKSERVNDIETLRKCDKTMLKQLGLKVGEIIKLSNLLDKIPTERGKELIYEIKKKYGILRDEKKGAKKKPGTGEVRKRTELKLHFGWVNSKDGKTFTRVGLVDGGGGRDIDSLSEDITVAEILAKTTEIFFPNGKSPLGDKDQLDIILGNYAKEPLSEFKDLHGKPCSLRMYLHERGLYPSKAPFYLMTVPIGKSVDSVLGSGETAKAITLKRKAKESNVNEDLETKDKKPRTVSSELILQPDIGILTERRHLIVKYQKPKMTDDDQEIASTISCYNRENCMEVAGFENPDVKDIGLSQFTPMDYGFRIARISDGKQVYYDANSTTESGNMLVLKYGPEKVWGYDGRELLLGIISSHHGKVTYTWTCDNEEVEKGEKNIILTVRRPGVYRCLVSLGDDELSSESVKIVEWGANALPPIEVVPIIDPKSLSYSHENLIGSGGFGSVYKGNWEGTEVAIKDIRVPKRGREHHLKLIWNEVEIHGKLRHPCIVQIMAMSNTANSVLIVSEFVDGCNLENAIFGNEEEKSVIAGNKQKIAKQICQAVAYMHTVNIVHQDIKPSNVLVNRKTGNAKMCDLGIGKLRQRGSTTTAKHEVPGTLMYMAPESLLSKKSNTSSDVWSLGCCLLELFTELDTWDIVQDEEPTSFITEKMMAGEKPPRICQLKTEIQRCFNYDPKDRPAASELIRCFTSDDN